jgi:hypothetical protein
MDPQTCAESSGPSSSFDRELRLGETGGVGPVFFLLIGETDHVGAQSHPEDGERRERLGFGPGGSACGIPWILPVGERSRSRHDISRDDLTSAML